MGKKEEDRDESELLIVPGAEVYARPPDGIGRLASLIQPG
jgi:hypothetical protein